MRRTDKEIKDPLLLESILRENKVIRIAWVSEEGPYLLPLHYGYEGRRIYIHSAPEGRKIELSKTAPRVCFEVSDSIEVVPADSPCGYSTRYRSVIGTGVIRVLEDADEKRKGLALIMERMTGKGDWVFDPEALTRVAVLRIDIERLTGKQSKVT